MGLGAACNSMAHEPTQRSATTMRRYEHFFVVASVYKRLTQRRRYVQHAHAKEAGLAAHLTSASDTTLTSRRDCVRNTAP
jgi:hypothetical protein